MTESEKILREIYEKHVLPLQREASAREARRRRAILEVVRTFQLFHGMLRLLSLPSNPELDPELFRDCALWHRSLVKMPRGLK